jgi:hypothetical protein
VERDLALGYISKEKAAKDYATAPE